MTDPRKPIVTPDDELSSLLMRIVETNLVVYCKATAQACQTNSCSVMFMTIYQLGLDLHELNPDATARYFMAMGRLFSPTTKPHQKAKAERDRKKAVAEILVSLDLEMARVEGRA